MRETDPWAGKRILFWAERPGGVDLSWIAKMFGMAGQNPQDFVRNDIPYDDRQLVARALDLRSTMNSYGGEVLIGYMGRASCRICGVDLGSRDLFGHGFVWPEKADHYITHHNVWTPDCDSLLTAVRRMR